MMTQAERDLQRFEDILNEIRLIRNSVQGLTKESFLADEDKKAAVAHHLTVIGEAANCIRPEIQARYPLIEWRGIIGLRNVLVHHYARLITAKPGWSYMSERQYSTMLALLIIPPLVALIGERLGIDEAAATERLYRSEFYEKLSDERLKLWHYSPVMLADMFLEADRTGVIPYPEEA